MMRILTPGMIGLLTLVSLGSVAHAQSLEQIHLKDGSVLEGYICGQIPGKTISVQTSKATLTASSDSLLSSNERQVMVAELPSEWKKWVMAQPEAMDRVALSTLQFRNSEYRDVLVLENGSKIKFLSLTNRVHTLPWSKVSKTVKLPKAEGVVSGIEDVVILKDGSRHIGQITEQVPGKTMKILLRDNSSATVNSSLVATLESQPMSDELTLLEQTPLLDRIYVRNSSVPTEGFIIRRDMGRELTVITRDGEEETIPLAKIVRYGKLRNPDYRVIADRQLAQGEVRLNDEEKPAWFAPLKSENGYFILDDASAVAKPGEEITVTANLENPSSAIYLIKAYRKDIPVAGSRKTIARDVFTYQDLVELALPIDRVLTPLGNTKVTFRVAGAGDYVLSIQGYKGFIVIHVN